MASVCGISSSSTLKCTACACNDAQYFSVYSISISMVYTSKLELMNRPMNQADLQLTIDLHQLKWTNGH